MSIRTLPADLAEKAKMELGEDTNRIKDDIQHLKDWIAKQPHLRARTDDQWLLAFLRGCKYSLERTKEKIDLYYTCRNTAPEFFKIKHNDPKFIEVLELGTFLILPKSKGTDPVVAIISPGTYNPDQYNIADIISVSTVLEKILLMENDNAVVTGIQNILNLEGVGLGHFLQMTPSVMKKMVVIGQDSLPFRIKGTHYLNTPTGFETMFNVMKPMLNEKNQQRLYVHNKDFEAMYQYIPKEMLPAEYGGYGGTKKEIIEYWKQKLQEWGPWLDEEEKFGTDEAKRPGKPKTAESMFGVDGSFRQLEFD